MERKAYIYILLAGCLWGSCGVFFKLLSAAGLSTMGCVALRSAASVVFYGAFLFFTDRKALVIAPKHWYYFFGTGVLSVLFYNWCYYSAIYYSSMSVAAVLLYTSPVFVMVLSAVFLGERITGQKLTALAVTFLGCALVTGFLPLGQETVTLRALLLGLGAGFGYALYSIFGKFALRVYGSPTITFYTFVFAAAFSLPFSGLAKHIPALAAPSVVVGALGLTVLCGIMPYLFYTKGLCGAEAGKAAVLATIEPFVASALGIAFYHETVTVYKLLGMAAIFCAIVLLNHPIGKKESADVNRS